MKFSTSNKTKLMATIATVLLMISAFTIMLNAPAQAQFLGEGEPGGVPGPVPEGVTPDWYVDTWALLSVRPNPVGLNQLVLVNLETQPAPGVDRMHEDYKIIISKPDGSTEEWLIDSYPDDGTMWFEYQVDQVGTWKFQFEFQGTYYPAGRYLDGIGPPDETIEQGGQYYEESIYYRPYTTPEIEVTVQEEPVLSWPETPGPPTDYWERPVPFERREWWPYIGNYPWVGPAGAELTYGPSLEKYHELYPDTNVFQPGKNARGTFIPWTLGPESAHVVWKRQNTLSGLLGGDWGREVVMAGIFGGMGLGGDPPGYGYPSVCFCGRCYQSVTKPGSGLSPVTMWQCYDIRTGEVYWEYPAPTTVMYFGTLTFTTSQVPNAIEYGIGAIPSGGGFPEHVISTDLIYIGSGRLMKFKPYTGELSANVSIAPLSSGTYYRNGYALSVQNLGGGEYRLINWTTLGSTRNFADRVVGNISWPISSLPETTDYSVGIAAQVDNVRHAGTYYSIRVRGISLKTGEILWDKELEQVSDYSSSTRCADHGKIAILTLNRGFVALNLDDGTIAWWSEHMDYPWDDAGFGGYSVQSAYGLLYRQAYSGIYAFNWDDGTIEWKYEAPAEYPYETPYVNEEGETMYSWNIGANIADGKMYAYNTEHSATLPITRGWKLHCINATTGEGIWKVALPGAASKHNPDVGPIHDGYLIVASSDGYSYVYGKGKSETTVSAPDVEVPKGSAITIKGTVLDQSPAQPGTPCVSKDSVAAWMEHVHLQRDLPQDLTGVPVALCAIGEDGSVIDISTTTTNAYYGTFSYAWTPPDEGKYEIIASFEGDESYGSSAASTAVTVGPVAEEVDLTPVEGSVSDVEDNLSTQTTYILAILVIVIIALVIAVYSLLKPRK
jgi:outer membrane protein assembly factor BamB